MTVSGPAGSPESDGALPTRRQARALREATASANAADTTVTPAPTSPSSGDAVDVADAGDVAADAASDVAAGTLAVPMPPVPVALVSPDLAVVVESAAPTPTDTVADDTVADDTAPLGRAEAAPVSALPALSLPAAARRRLALTSRRAPAAPKRGPATGTSRSTAVRRPNLRKPLAKIVTLMAIPAVFLTAALPAYAFSPEGEVGGVSAQVAGGTQALTVAAAATAVSISTDGFTATSQSELDEIQAGQVARAAQERAAESSSASVAEFAVYGVRADGDDYPWPAAGTESQGGGLSPLGYYYRECVDFVAWRLNRDAGSTAAPWKMTWSTMTPGGGDGSSWAGAWAAKGWPTSSTPVVGAVATFSYNHVAYVQSVPGNGTVVLEEYNWMGSHAYHTRTVPISDVQQFLYPPG